MESEDVKVIKRDRTYATVRSIWDSHDDAVEDVDALYGKLKVLTNVDAAVKAAHITDIEKKYKKPTKESNPEEPQTKPAKSRDGVLESADATISGTSDATKQQLICPWCGKELILRTAKKGTNAGKQFYGCSGFPKCRYVKNV